MTAEIKQESQPQDNKELNFEKLRKQLDQERAARLQAEQRISEVEKLTHERNKPQVEDDEDDEPYVDHKKLNKKLKSFEEKFEQKIDQRAEEKARRLLDEEKRVNYLKENPDFQNVMNSEVVQKFADSHPHLAETILRMPEGFERQKLVYANIKALGLDKPKSKEPSIQEKIDANRRSPFMPSPGGQGPGYSAMGDFTDAGKKSSYDKMKELQRRLKG